jgi:xanthine dehydrogenase YagS FAD-binding subunit
MQPFVYSRDSHDKSGRYLAGGTTLIDLMKLNVETPEAVIDIKRAQIPQDLSSIRADGRGLRLGALATMAQAAADPQVRERYPVIAQSLLLAASPQIRNMATLGGNVLQRTRCTYFRDVSWTACNKREPGTGCAALHGFNRMHAVLGTSDHCIASYPGDFAQALIALDAQVETNERRFPFDDLHRDSNTPHIETNLRNGEMIRFLTIPEGDHRRSLYLKVRDRQSYAFGLATAAVSLELDGRTVRACRIGLGGIAYKPWRAREAEDVLKGQVLTDDSAARAAEAALAGAKAYKHNGFKIALAKQTLIRALLEAQSLEI